MTKKIFRSVFAVAMTVLIACLAIIMGILYSYYNSIQENQLKSELSLAASGVENLGTDYLNGLKDGSCRLTWVSADGDVIFDSESDAESMENHAHREEIQQAFENGEGSSSRFSSTLTEETVYYARLLSDGTVLRISESRITMLALVLSMMQPVLIILIVALILSAVFAGSISKKIVKPLEAINLDQPMENDTYDELTPLLSQLEQQHRQIRNQRTQLADRKNEFLAVTNNMNEGLILLNEQGVILSINSSAARFFGENIDYTGKDFFIVERDIRINDMINESRSKGKGEILISRSGHEYQMSASAVKHDDKIFGTVILIFDVTDKVFAERNRREFTANVSHELKTPLQSIIGSAELMENGLVKPEDMNQFVRRIHSEASRLVNLIDDIIRLSQLDEKVTPAEEETDLHDIILKELENLKPAADSRNISLEYTGRPTPFFGVKPLLQEIIHNLFDNAVKYNKEGGRVCVILKSDDNSVTVSIRDTGIGIPPEEQNRIFERFYRVDKSRSKQIGGTGLGLSIVKHAVLAMDGKISVDSSPGEYTEITVTLPRK